MMIDTAHKNSIQIQKHLFKENNNLSNYSFPLAFAVGGCLFFALLGAALQVIYTVSGLSNEALNYAEVGSIVMAFVFFGLIAHFMDKSDESEHRSKRIRIEKFNKH